MITPPKPSLSDRYPGLFRVLSVLLGIALGISAWGISYTIIKVHEAPPVTIDGRVYAEPETVEPGGTIRVIIPFVKSRDCAGQYVQKIEHVETSRIRTVGEGYAGTRPVGRYTQTVLVNIPIDWPKGVSHYISVLWYDCYDRAGTITVRPPPVPFTVE